MKVVDGSIPGKKLNSMASLQYNGRPGTEMKLQLKKLIGTVPQHDVHLPYLTVKETLDFARNVTFSVSCFTFILCSDSRYSSLLETEFARIHTRELPGQQSRQGYSRTWARGMQGYNRGKSPAARY